MIIKFIYGLIEGIAKVIAWLLKVLGLWVPFLYCFVFIIACALSSTEFESVELLFYVGLVLSFLCAALIAVYRPMPKKAKGGTSPYVLKPLKRKEADDYYAPNQKIAKRQVIREPQEVESEPQEVEVEQFEVQQEPAPPPPRPKPVKPQEQAPPRPKPQAQPRQDDNSGQIDFFKKPKPKPAPTPPPQPSYQPQPYFTYDTPMVFRTRVDPNILIYEYTDRIEVYRMTSEGLTLVDVERKA